MRFYVLEPDPEDYQSSFRTDYLAKKEKYGEANRCKACGKLIVESSTWSGEDIFIARGLPGIFLITEKFKTFCEECKIKNAVLIPAEEYSYDFYPWERRRKLKRPGVGP